MLSIERESGNIPPSYISLKGSRGEKQSHRTSLFNDRFQFPPLHLVFEFYWVFSISSRIFYSSHWLNINISGFKGACFQVGPYTDTHTPETLRPDRYTLRCSRSNDGLSFRRHRHRPLELFETHNLLNSDLLAVKSVIDYVHRSIWSTSEEYKS